MSERISALIDGELEREAVLHSCSQLPHDSQGRDCWATYQLIGDALRSSDYLDHDISARVMAALTSEPTVLAPGALAQSAGAAAPVISMLRPLAIAASLAGVLAVSVMVWPSQGGQVQQVAVAPEAQVPQALRDENLQAYVLAHQAQAPSTTVHSAAHYIKTVSLDTENVR